MTKPLDPEIKALRALGRAFDQLPREAQPRALDWFCAAMRAQIQKANLA